jgi:hypothetical protein
MACLAWSSSEALDPRYESSARGMQTGSIGFLGDSQSSKKYTAYYYDKMGRVVQQNGTSHFNPTSNYSYGYDHYSYDYDFKGNVLHKRHYQRSTFAGNVFL